MRCHGVWTVKKLPLPLTYCCWGHYVPNKTAVSTTFKHFSAFSTNFNQSWASVGALWVGKRWLWMMVCFWVLRRRFVTMKRWFVYEWLQDCLFVSEEMVCVRWDGLCVIRTEFVSDERVCEQRGDGLFLSGEIFCFVSDEEAVCDWGDQLWVMRWFASGEDMICKWWGDSLFEW